jgi:hypothetical protein
MKNGTCLSFDESVD